MLRAGVWRIAMRRRTAGNEAHSGKAALLQRLLREAQMSKMDRVESAAKDTDWYDAHSLQRQPADIRQHMSEIGRKARRRRTIYHAVVIR